MLVSGSPKGWRSRRQWAQPRAGGQPTIVALRVILLLALLLGITANETKAQRRPPDFLFRPPPVTLTLRGGVALANASSDLFEFTTEELTLRRRDFSGPTLELDVGIRVHPRADLVLGIGHSGAKPHSEFRHWVDQDDLPIEQTTRFQRVPLTASVRTYLTPRGRQVGSLAWIPNRWAPYIGVGGGALWYRFHQEGDFVDFQTLEIFPTTLTSSGWTYTLHGFAGTEIRLGPTSALTVETMYRKASARPSPDFQGFDPIDLSGFNTSLGIQFRFR